MSKENQIYLVKKEGEYIAAILSGITNMLDYMKRIDPSLMKTLHVEPIRSSYPFQILETANGHEEREFWILDTEYLQENFRRHLSGSRPEEKVLTLYEITEDFLGDPKNPGRDYMGILSHKHFEESGAW